VLQFSQLIFGGVIVNCQRCASNIPEDSKWCPLCGLEIETGSAQEDTQSVQFSEQEEPQSVQFSEQEEPQSVQFSEQEESQSVQFSEQENPQSVQFSEQEDPQYMQFPEQQPPIYDTPYPSPPPQYYVPDYPTNAYFQAPPNPGAKSNATAALVLGILALLLPIPVIDLTCGIVALALSARARKEGYTGGVATAGFVLAIIGTVGSAVFTLFFVIIFILGMGFAFADLAQQVLHLPNWLYQFSFLA